MTNSAVEESPEIRQRPIEDSLENGQQPSEDSLKNGQQPIEDSVEDHVVENGHSKMDLEDNKQGTDGDSGGSVHHKMVDDCLFGVQSNVDQVGASSQIGSGNLLHYAELSYDNDISTSSTDPKSDVSSSEYCPMPM